MPSPPNLSCGATNRDTYHGVWWADAFAVTWQGTIPRDVGLQALENKVLSWSIIGKSAPILAEITIRKSQETVAVLMEGTPGHIDVDTVHQAIRALPGVHSVHDLHIWTITSGLIALSAHVRIEEKSHHALLKDVRHVLYAQFGISHSTIQIEHEEQENDPTCR